MRKNHRVVAYILVPILLTGCASQQKTSEAKQLEQIQAAQAQHKQDLLNPEADFEKAARLYIELGLAYLKDGQVGRAKEKLLRAKKLAPQLSEVHYALGYYMESVGEIDQAEENYLKAISKKPKDGIAHNNYGTFLCRQGQYRRAEQEFLKAVEDPEYSKTAEAYENAGLCVLPIPNFAKAKAYFEKAVRIDPRRTHALLELGILSFQNKEFARALEYHSLYNQQAPASARSLWLGLKLADHFNQPAKKENYERQLRQKFPKSAEYQEIQQHRT